MQAFSVRCLRGNSLARFLVAAVLGLPVALVAQKGAPPPPASTGAGASSVPGPTAPGSNNTGTRNGTWGTNIPNYPNNNPGIRNRPIFLAGRVQFDDGSPANSNIRIQRVCGASIHTETHTDSRGQFSFQVGQSTVSEMDASESSIGGFNRGSNANLGGDSGGFGSARGGGDLERQLQSCDLRADYPGYRSDVVRLAGIHSLDQPDLGTIVLHHIGNVQGSTISVTTTLAPKNAQKAYSKAMQLIERGKMEEAQQRLREATSIYPKYAVAWYALGQAEDRAGQTAEAQKSFQAAIDADSHYVSPYDQLARMAAQAGNWEQAAAFSKQAISLNSVEFPSSLWYNALASYQLKKPTEAEQSVHDLLKLDTRHDYPQAETLMGQLLLDKGRLPDAAVHFRNFLALSPKASNADAIKELLTRIDGKKVASDAPNPQP